MKIAFGSGSLSHPIHVIDGTDEPVMVILSAQDRENILRMDPERQRYVSGPMAKTHAELFHWMDLVIGWEHDRRVIPGRHY